MDKTDCGVGVSRGHATGESLPLHQHSSSSSSYTVKATEKQLVRQTETKNHFSQSVPLSSSHALAFSRSWWACLPDSTGSSRLASGAQEVCCSTTITITSSERTRQLLQGRPQTVILLIGYELSLFSADLSFCCRVAIRASSLLFVLCQSIRQYQ
jgi:hypothetical protein